MRVLVAPCPLQPLALSVLLSFNHFSAIQWDFTALLLRFPSLLRKDPYLPLGIHSVSFLWLNFESSLLFWIQALFLTWFAKDCHSLQGWPFLVQMAVIPPSTGRKPCTYSFGWFCYKLMWHCSHLVYPGLVFPTLWNKVVGLRGFLGPSVTRIGHDAKPLTKIHLVN